MKMDAELNTKTTLYLIFESIVAIFSILGNTLVVITYLRDPSLRTPTNLYVFSLAITDLLTSGVAIPLYVRTMLIYLPRDFLSCVCVQSLILTFCTVSIFHLTAVSFDRYMVVVWHRKPVAHEAAMRRAWSFVGTAWLAGILIGCLPLMGWNARKPNLGNELDKCEFLEVIDMKYLMFLFYATIMAPTVIMIFFYGNIYRVVRLQNRRMSRYSIDLRSSIGINEYRKTTADDTSSVDQLRKFTNDSLITLVNHSQSIDSSEQNRKPSTLFQSRSCMLPGTSAAMTGLQKRQSSKTKRVIFSLVLVIICFFISWYPLYMMNAVAYYCETCTFETWWFYAPIVLSHLSSAVNPLIYARTMPGYKEAFLETLTCGRIKAEPNGSRRKKRRSGLIMTDFHGTVRKPATCATWPMIRRDSNARNIE